MIPTHVSRDDLIAALEPLCRLLLHSSTRNVFDSPGVSIGEGKITFLVPVRHAVSPRSRTEGVRNLPAPLPPHPQGLEGVEPVRVGEDDAAEWAYPVTVEVLG